MRRHRVNGPAAVAADDSAQVFTEAYRAHAASLLAYLRSQGVDDPEAVTQDVFVAVYPRLKTLSGGSDGLRALLFTIAHARVVDHHRRRSRTPLKVEYDPLADPRSTPSAEDHVIRGELGVGQLLAVLNPEHQEVIALRILGELTIEEVAQIMGRSAGAIKQLQRRALIALRREAGLDGATGTSGEDGTGCGLVVTGQSPAETEEAR